MAFPEGLSAQYNPIRVDVTYISVLEEEMLKAGDASKDWKKRGVVTHSSGNHAQAIALAARDLGIQARIVMPEVSMPNKINAARGYGADIIFSGYTLQERQAEVAKIIKETGARFVPPFDHPDVILGQGTSGLELQEQVRSLRSKTGSAVADGWLSRER